SQPGSARRDLAAAVDPNLAGAVGPGRPPERRGDRVVGKAVLIEVADRRDDLPEARLRQSPARLGQAARRNRLRFSDGRGDQRRERRNRDRWMGISKDQRAKSRGRARETVRSVEETGLKTLHLERLFQAKFHASVAAVPATPGVFIAPRRPGAPAASP